MIEKNKCAKKIAQNLLQVHDNFGELHLTLKTVSAEFLGLTLVQRNLLQTIFEIGLKLRQDKPIQSELVFNHPDITGKFISSELEAELNEVFACLYLTTHCKMIKFKKLFFGTVNEASVYPREIIRQGLVSNAAKVIVAHNHPSGEAKPSSADKLMTKEIKKALQIMDMELIDHIVVGHRAHFSFAQANLL